MCIWQRGHLHTLHTGNISYKHAKMYLRMNAWCIQNYENVVSNSFVPMFKFLLFNIPHWETKMKPKWTISIKKILFVKHSISIFIVTERQLGTACKVDADCNATVCHHGAFHCEIHDPNAEHGHCNCHASKFERHFTEFTVCLYLGVTF